MTGPRLWWCRCVDCDRRWTENEGAMLDALEDGQRRFKGFPCPDCGSVCGWAKPVTK